MPNYCNITTDLYRAYPRVEEFLQAKTVKGWVVDSGSRYKISGVGYAEQLIENGTQMTAAASAAAVDAAGEYFYDADADTLYAQAISGLVTDSGKVYHWGIDRDTLKSWAVERASQEIEARLDNRFPIPLLEDPRGSSTRKWDGPIIQATALMACAIMAARKEPKRYDANGGPENIAAELEAGAIKIIEGYNDGKLRFSWELTPDEIGAGELVPASANTSVGMFQIKGEYTGTQEQPWVIKITTAGQVGTAKFKLSTDGGTTFGAETTTSKAWTSLSGGFYIRFFDRGGSASTAFVVNDQWDMMVVPTTASLTRTRIGSQSLIG